MNWSSRDGQTTAEPAGRPIMRVIKGLGALTILIVAVLGVPTFLAVFVGSPFPSSFRWSRLADALTRPDDGTVLVSLIAVVAWLAWAVFTVSVVVELIALVSRQRFRPRLPGLRGPQRLASGLVLMVASLVAVTPQLGHAAPAHSAPQIAPVQLETIQVDVVTKTPEQAGPQRAAPSESPSAAADSESYTVQRGDDLWTLAERFYGEGREWRRIAAANPGVLTGGPDRLEAGWSLLIPGGASASGRIHVVVRGDTLSSIAEQAYGTAEQWPRIFEANRFQLDDPDELAVGLRLVVPAKPGASDHSDKKVKSADRDAKVVDRQQAEKPSEPKRPDDERPSAKAESLPTPPKAPAPADQGHQVPPTERTKQQVTEESVVESLVAGVAGVGGLLAAAVVSGTAVRRRRQLQLRPVGRRIAQPTPAAQLVESQLGRRQRPMGLRTLDLATRAISAHCHHTRQPLPLLEVATVTDDELVLEMGEPGLGGPDAFEIEGTTWRLTGLDADRLRSVPGLSDAVRPYPALATLGTTDHGGQIVVDLEAVGLTSIDSADPMQAEASLAALAIELSCSSWAEELELILVGTCPSLPAALGQHNVTYTEDLDPVLDRLSRRASAQRDQGSAQSVAAHRIDPELADPWVPTIMLISKPLSSVEQRRLRQLVLAEPPASIAVVAVGLDTAPCRLVMAAAEKGQIAKIEPYGLVVRPQLLAEPAAGAVVELVEATGRTDTTPAPWWFDEETAAEPDPPDNVTYLGRRFGRWRPADNHDDEEKGAAMGRQGDTGAMSSSQPVLQLLGPVELRGAAGVPPTRAARQCLEYCAWLLEHPGTRPAEMGTALMVADGTRRSNMSRLRAWLGADELDQPYLPDAYSGRIRLHPAVSSDWQRLQILTSRGVNRASTSGLEAALQLVRGAPFADAAPGQWHWAEGLRIDMLSAIRDIGVELSNRALAESNVDLARWAASRALVVAPGDELLLVARIKTEHRAGNHPEVERLTLQLAAHARLLEVELRPETVDVLQEMVEGQVRARLA